MRLRNLASLLLVLLPLAACAAPPRTLYLSGRGKDDAIPWQFRCSHGPKANAWTTLPVPSQWEFFGHGSFNYGVTDKTPTPVTGEYKTTFQLPADWQNLRVFVVFEGAMTDTTVRLNGRDAGPTHQGGFYRFQFEITNLLKPGENELAATVTDVSANKSINSAERQGDYWNFGGIYRPVYLQAVPRHFIERIALDARADGTFALDAFLNGQSAADTLEAQILTLDGQPFGPSFSQKLPAAGAPVRLQAKAESPRLWTAETPNLYLVEVRLKQGDTVLHSLRQRFGFRTIELRPGDGIYLNGKRIILQGANRHSFWPDSGRCLSEKISRDDILLLKGMNANAVRMSHYPPDAHFLDLCDELGLYVLDELAGWQHHYDTPTGRRLIGEMLARDVNHPSILFWDNGNEGGWNRELDDDFARHDPQQRRVIHPWEKFRDLDTKHYPNWSLLNERLKEPTVFMPTEFLHALYDGGAGAGLEDYWARIRSVPHAAGGFIWALVDESVRRPNPGGTFAFDSRGNLAPDGIVGPYREKEGSYFTIQRIWSPVQIVERTLPPDFSGTLTLENRYAFTNLNTCRFHWTLQSFSGPNEPEKIVALNGTAPAPDVAPGATGKLVLPLPADWKNAHALRLTATDSSDRELCAWSFPLPGAFAVQKLPAAPGHLKISTDQAADGLTVLCGDLALRFDQATGCLAAVARAGKPFSLANGPRPVTGSARLASLTHRADGPDYLITATYEGELKSAQWRIRPNGWVQLTWTCTAAEPAPFLGVTFDYPEKQVTAKTWLGQGPYRVWKNRLLGPTFGLWHNACNDTVTGESRSGAPQVYPEFKGYFADVRWLRLETTEGPLTVLPAPANPFVRVFTPSVPAGKLPANTAQIVPPGHLSFLHAIPAMGNKFQPARDIGPQSQLNEAPSAPLAGTLDLYFGN